MPNDTPIPDFTRRVAEHAGIAVARKTPDGEKKEFWLPKRWPTFTVSQNPKRLPKFVPGEDGLLGVANDLIAVVDIDTKNGADIEAVRDHLDMFGIRIYVEVETPSGGRHFYVPGHPDLASVAAKKDKDGLAGFPGVEILSHGRGFYLPGTTRAKYDGAPYVVLLDDLDALVTTGREDTVSQQGMLTWAEKGRIRPKVTYEVAEPWTGGKPTVRQQAYLDGVLKGVTKRLAETAGGGRNTALYDEARSVGSFIAGAGLDTAAGVDALMHGAGENGLIHEEGERATMATIKSGISWGRKHPRAVPEHEEEEEEEEPVFEPVADTDDVPTVEDAPALFDEIEETIKQYLYLPESHHYATVVLWCAATHVLTHMEYATRLNFKSPEPQCGKTRALEVVKRLSYQPLSTSNATVAAITRSLGAIPPTLMIDEADTVFGKKTAENNEDLRAVLNAGHARGAPLLRWNQQKNKRESLNTFAMAALAGIGDLPETVTQRSAVIPLRRRPKDHRLKPFRQKRDGSGVILPLGKRLAAWATTFEPSDEEIELPVEDRDADNWESLVAVADAVGGDWPARARAAAVALTRNGAEPDKTFNREALEDVRRVWTPGAISMHSETLVNRLLCLEASPWSNYGNGRTGITAHQLARLLKPYGVQTKQVKIAGKNLWGYRYEDWACKSTDADCVPSGGLKSAWDSYLDEGEIGAEAEKSDPRNVANQNAADVFADLALPTDEQ